MESASREVLQALFLFVDTVCHMEQPDISCISGTVTDSGIAYGTDMVFCAGVCKCCSQQRVFSFVVYQNLGCLCAENTHYCFLW